MIFYHIVDHEGFGTIHKLLLPLCKAYSHHVMITYELLLTNNEIKKSVEMNKAYIIVHSTGRMNTETLDYVMSHYQHKRIAIFMHTSYRYQLLKKRENDMIKLQHFHRNEGITVLVPSKEVAEQFASIGVKALVIQLGIPNVELIKSYKEYRMDLEQYYHKIITTCSSNKSIYRFVKGIDLFEDIMKSNHLCQDALIAGINTGSFLRCMNFPENDFLNILYHSKMYVQCSRYESYNLTAVYAKRFRVPAIILASEGNVSCMGRYVFQDLDAVNHQIMNIMSGMNCKDQLDFLYNDSIVRESLVLFDRAFNTLESRCYL